MQYKQRNVALKDGGACRLRNAVSMDAEEVLAHAKTVRGETDLLMSYPEETCHSLSEMKEFLEEQSRSEIEIQLCAIVDGKIVGMAGIMAVCSRKKTRHRAALGIDVERRCWNRGIGRILLEAAVKCAAHAGYRQLELEVVSENERAISMYRKAGFVEYGRNPRGFLTKSGAWQELILMRMTLD